MRPSTHLEIRPLQADDLAAVLAIQLRCHDSTRIESAQSFDAKRRASPTSCFMARLDGRSVGYLHGLVHPALHASGNNAWVDELWVDEDVRRRGVARALMTAFDV